MEIKSVPISKLKPAEYNPRADLKPGDPEYEAIRNSLNRWGYVAPMLWNKKSGNLISGHQRLKVLKDLKYKEAQVVVVDVSEAEEKALNIAMNRISGTWDWEKLQTVLTELKESNFDLTLTGFRPDEIENLLAADWKPPEITAGGGDETVEPPVFFEATKEQAETISRAIEKAKAIDPSLGLTDGRALELICGEYLKAE